jgi:choline kinase
MQAVILVAGKGTRLGEINGGKPKCMTRLGCQTIIERQIESLRAVGVGQIVIVVGYMKNMIIDFIRKRYTDIQFVENKNYSFTNTIYSLYLATPFLYTDFFYLNGDVLFYKTLLEKLLEESGTGLAVESKICGDEEVKVQLVGDRICNISKKVDTKVAAGEFVGVAMFRKPIHHAFFNSLKYGVESKGVVKEYFEWALDHITTNEYLTAVDVTDEPVVEIDFPEDLEKAKNMVETKNFDFVGNAQLSMPDYLLSQCDAQK